jgi:lysophospholipase L1-like esterase
MRLLPILLTGLCLASTAQAAAPKIDILPSGVPADYIATSRTFHGRTSSAAALDLVLSGKATPDDDLPTLFQWPGIYLEAEFGGPEILLRFDNTTDAFNIAIDGGEPARLVKPGSAVYRIAGLTPGWHRIRIEKTNESQDTVGNFTGLWIAPKEDFRWTAPRTRQIEFIGDSYTVGYGNTAGKRECTKDELWATTNTSKAFGPLTAKHYDADYQINAFSGRGVVRNYDGFAGAPLPGLYPYALYDGKTEYHDPKWQPQVIVIALGTNDFSTPVHAGETWKTQDELVKDYEASYAAFVTALRAKNPDAGFVLISYDTATSPAINAVRDRLKAAGETKVDVLEITGFTKNACDYHPDTDDDRKISDTLITYFDTHPALWQGH